MRSYKIKRNFIRIMDGSLMDSHIHSAYSESSIPLQRNNKLWEVWEHSHWPSGKFSATFIGGNVFTMSQSSKFSTWKSPWNPLSGNTSLTTFVIPLQRVFTNNYTIHQHHHHYYYISPGNLDLHDVCINTTNWSDISGRLLPRKSAAEESHLRALWRCVSSEWSAWLAAVYRGQKGANHTPYHPY